MFNPPVSQYKDGDTNYCNTLHNFWDDSIKYLKQISSGQQYVINKVLFVTASDLVGSYALNGISLELIFKSLEACVVREKELSGNSKFSKLSGINMETCCFSGYNFNVTHSMHCKDINPNILSVPPLTAFSILMSLAFLGSISFRKALQRLRLCLLHGLQEQFKNNLHVLGLPGPQASLGKCYRLTINPSPHYLPVPLLPPLGLY